MGSCNVPVATATAVVFEVATATAVVFEVDTVTAMALSDM